ncbi:MAG: hypothetical protein ACI9JK_000947 [Phycisphaerales bacterium]|jgi:hypothetical protein
MDYRKITIRVLLCSLGIAAVSGLLAIFLPGGTGFTGRLLGTAILTAVCSAFLLFSVQRSEVPNTKSFGISLGFTTLCVYFCTVIAIWAHYLTKSFFNTSNLEEKFAVSALLIAGCGILVSLGFLCTPHKKIRLSGAILSGVWLISLLLWLVVIWSGKSSVFAGFNAEYVAYPLQTLFPLLVLCAIRRNNLYMGIAIGFAVTCIVASQIALFTSNGSIEDNNSLFLFILSTGCLSAFLAVLNIIHFRPVSKSIRWAEIPTCILTSAAILLFAIAVYYNANNMQLPELLLRLGVGLGILSSTSILGLLIGQFLRSSVFTTYSGAGIQAVCPRCLSEFFVPSGKSHCCICNLRMKLYIESPNCSSCGYDISKQEDCVNCPECGKPIKSASTLQ